MAKVTLYVPDALLDDVYERLGDANWSAWWQDRARAELAALAEPGAERCAHDVLVCVACSSTFKRSGLTSRATSPAST